MIKDINLEELQKYSNLEILHFLTSAVREHPLYAHYLGLLEDLLANDLTLREKSLKELSNLLQLSDGFLLGLILSMKDYAK